MLKLFLISILQSSHHAVLDGSPLIAGPSSDLQERGETDCFVLFSSRNTKHRFVDAQELRFNVGTSIHLVFFQDLHSSSDWTELLSTSRITQSIGVLTHRN